MTNDYIEDSLDRQTDRQYENCISLGWFCGTASSLSKLGLRNHSGPFDWYFSHLWAVIAQIENGFNDFMHKDNLEIVDDDVKVFKDTKYGFYCNHDVESNFEDEYPKIYEKYMRRVDTFMCMIKHPTVFYRCVRDYDEVEYINKNWEHIDELLKSFNSNNRIVYVCHSGIKGITDQVKCFDLKIEQYIGKTYEMRHMFDKSKELITFSESLLSVDQMQRNIDFDNQTNAQRATAAYVNKCIEENIDGIDRRILDAFCCTVETGIYLWGAGKYGIPLAKYLCDREVNVQGIIDNKKSGEVCDGFQIISPEAIPFGAKIFIAVLNKDANNSITTQIEQINIGACIVRYEDLYEVDLNL